MNITLNAKDIINLVVRDLQARHSGVPLYGKLDIVDGEVVCNVSDTPAHAAGTPYRQKIVDLVSKVMPHLVRGEMIAAIKLVRTETNCGLKQGKDWVDELNRQYEAGCIAPNMNMNYIP